MGITVQAARSNNVSVTTYLLFSPLRFVRGYVVNRRCREETTSDRSHERHQALPRAAGFSQPGCYAGVVGLCRAPKAIDVANHRSRDSIVPMASRRKDRIGDPQMARPVGSSPGAVRPRSGGIGMTFADAVEPQAPPAPCQTPCSSDRTQRSSASCFQRS